MVVKALPLHCQENRLEKFELYAQYQVPEYWIVDPEQRIFDFFVNRNG